MRNNHLTICNLGGLLPLPGFFYIDRRKVQDGRRRPVEKGGSRRQPDGKQQAALFYWSTSTVDVEGCLFLGRQQAALFITPPMNALAYNVKMGHRFLVTWPALRVWQGGFNHSYSPTGSLYSGCRVLKYKCWSIDCHV